MITNYLDELYPNPVCELNYNCDYELLIAVMLSAQTTDKRVNEVTNILFKKYKGLQELSNANIDDIKKIVRPLGNYNKKSSNVILIAKSLLNRPIENNRQYLETLPGVGRKTTNVVLSILYDEPYIAVDTHVSRVSKRLNIASSNDDVLKVEQKLYKYFKNSNYKRLHQQLVLFGRYKCKAIKPECLDCKLKNICKRGN